MNLVPSLAFTALLEMHPTYASMSTTDPRAQRLLGDLTADMQSALSQGNPDLWQFAEQWISDRDPRILQEQK